jgi:hypothetical protein
VHHPLASASLIASPGSLPDAAVLASILAILAIDLRLIFYCLDDLNRRRIVTVFDKQMWTVVIIVGGPVGQAAYWLYGRGEY